MSGVRVKKAVATLLLVLFWPQWALAQSAVAAGVVTTLAGQATVTRVSLPQQAVPLNFKDEVFVRDTIRTREKSVVRMLLGGKALVTVRELSAFTITEEAGRSRVDLESGKLALSVARQRMRPGEVIEIRTPNAIAGVRGTVVIAEVVRSTAQVGPGSPGVTTNFFVLHGGPVDVVPRGLSGARPSIVGPLQSVSVSGTTAGQVRAIQPGQVAQIVSGLKSGPQHQDTPTNEKQQVSNRQQQMATVLAALLAPEPSAPGGQQQQQQQGQGDSQQGQTDPNLVAAASPISDSTPPPSGGSLTPNNPVNPPIIPTVLPGPSGPADIPSVAPISNTTRNMTAAETLLTFPSGTSVQQQPNTLVSISNSTVTQSPSGDLVLSPAGANSTIVGNLLDAMNSDLTAGSHLLEVAGTLSSSAYLLATDPTTVTAPNLIQVDLGGSLTVAGSLLTDIGGTYNVSGDVTTVFGTLATMSAAPAFSLSSTTIDSGTDSGPTSFFRVNGGSGVATMAGPLITASNVSYTQRGSAVLEVSGGGSLTSTATSPFMGFSGGTLTLGSGVIATLIGTGSTATLAGSLFAAAGTPLDVAGSGRHFIEVSGGSSLTLGAGIDLSNTSLNLGTEPLIKLRNASTLRFTGAAPTIRLTNASLVADQLVYGDGTGNTFELRGTAFDLTNSTLSVRAYGDTNSGLDTDQITDRFTALSLNQPFVRLASSTLTTTQLGEGGFDLGDGSAATPPTVQGVGLVTSGTVGSPTTINLQGKLFHLEAGIFTATNPLVQLDHTTVNQTVTTEPFTRIDFQGKTGSTTGQFLTASSSTLNASGSFFKFENGALTSATTSPFLSLSSTNLTAPDLIRIDASGSLTVMGSLLEVSGASSLTLGGGLLYVDAGSQLDGNGNTNPLFSITGGAHSIATNVGVWSAIAALYGRTSTQAPDLLDLEAVDAVGTTLTLGTDTPVRNQAGDGLDLVGATVGSATPSQRALILDSALISASAPLLNMTALSSLTTALDAINVQNRASLISVGPIVKLDNSALTINNGAAVNVTGGSFLRVTGDLITLSNGSTLSILSGPVLSLNGGSVVNISGALIAFGTLSGNTVNITNNLCAGACPTLGGFKVYAPGLTQGVNFPTSAPNLVKNLGTNSLNISSTAALISLSGSTSKLTVGQ